MDIKQILEDHKLWLESDWEDGVRADLRWATLTGANLYRANLRRANLTGANLTGAELRWANLYRANMTGTNLTDADLTGTNLTGAKGIYGGVINYSGYPMYIVNQGSKPARIHAGCRWFTESEAREHWNPEYDVSRRKIAIVDLLVDEAKHKGWTL